MFEQLAYPPSFPNAREQRFLSLVLAPDSEVRERWDAWKRDVAFEDIDPAIMGLLPLLHLRLSALGIEDELSGRVRGVYRLAWFKNQRLLEAARELADAGAHAGIPLIMLKGIALVTDTYRDPGARFLGDGDILVAPGHAAALLALMRKRGWRFVDPSFVADPSHAFRYDQVTHATPLVGRHGVELEIHWRLFHVDAHDNALRLLFLRSAQTDEDTDGFRRRAAPLMLRGTPCLALSREDTLLHILVHGAEGNPYRPVRWVADAVTLMRAHGIDWDALAAHAIRNGRQVEAGLGLRYIDEHFEQVPASFFAALGQAPAPRVLVRRYRRASRGTLPPLGNFPALWYRYWMIEADGPFFLRCWRFPRYAARAWKLDRARDIVPFMARKIAARLGRAHS